MENSHHKIINEQTFRYYYDLYFTDLCKSLNYYTNDLELIEDTVQDVFVNLWENRTTVEITYIKTYLFSSVRNRMLNFIRDNKKKELRLELYQTNLFDSEINEISDSFNEELYQTTQEAINTLPKKCKELFILNKQNHITCKQIAADKHISVKTVENQISIALNKIRTYVSKKAVFSVLLTSFFVIP